ncbi:MAG: hypothetical protein AAGA57_07670 [Planctomycetota bacterium]
MTRTAGRSTLAFLLTLGVPGVTLAQGNTESPATQRTTASTATPVANLQTSLQTDLDADLRAHEIAMDRALTWLQDARDKRARTAATLADIGVDNPDELRRGLRPVEREIQLAEQAFRQYQQRYRQLVALRDGRAEDNQHTANTSGEATESEAAAVARAEPAAHDPVLLQLQEQRRALENADQTLAQRGLADSHPHRRQLQAQLRATELRIIELQDQADDPSDPGAAAAANPGADNPKPHHLAQARQAIEQQLLTLETQRQAVEQQYGPGHPALGQIHQAMQAMQRELQRLDEEAQAQNPSP